MTVSLLSSDRRTWLAAIWIVLVLQSPPSMKVILTGPLFISVLYGAVRSRKTRCSLFRLAPLVIGHLVVAVPSWLCDTPSILFVVYYLSGLILLLGGQFYDSTRYTVLDLLVYLDIVVSVVQFLFYAYDPIGFRSLGLGSFKTAGIVGSPQINSYFLGLSLIYILAEKKNVLWYVSACLVIVTTRSNMALFYLSASILYLFWKAPYKREGLIVLAFVAAAGLMLLANVLDSPIQIFGNLGVESHLPYYRDMYDSLANINPWIGTGLGSATRLSIDSLGDASSLEFNESAALGFVSEIGLFGIFVMSASMFLTTVRIFNGSNSESRQVRSIYLVFLFVNLVLQPIMSSMVGIFTFFLFFTYQPSIRDR